MNSTNESLDRIATFIETNIRQYPKNSPFNPPEKYPEYNGDIFDESNTIYPAVRDILYSLGLDQGNFGTQNWNPLGDIIKPGYSVVIKPNFVSEPRFENTSFEAIITHPSVIRPLIDYCLIALNGKGSLVIADSPQTDSSIEKIKHYTKIDDIINAINSRSNVKISFIDLRCEHTTCKDGVINQREVLAGDSKGYTVVDLGSTSLFSNVEEHMNKIYGADYDYEELRKHHNKGKHEYYVSNTILDADVIINIPKMKTHKKAGITVCLKNLVGINGNKNYLPHHRFGSQKGGGDEYPGYSIVKQIESNVAKTLFKIISRFNLEGTSFVTNIGKFYNSLNCRNIVHLNSGNWYGNDTIWRTIVDLNYIVFYANKNGELQKTNQRKYFSLVDGIIAGEGEGPMNPTEKECGILIAGFCPVLVDRLCAGLMGFDWNKIPSIYQGERKLVSEENRHLFTDCKNVESKNFLPPAGWQSYIELEAFH